MIPIYEQDDGRGIGHNLDSFMERFEDICRQHLTDGRAKVFAFIFYDFTDESLRHILRDQGAFAKLDRLSGNNLSIFYLHTGTRHAIERFNEEFLTKLEIEDYAIPPCVVFFKQDGESFNEISVAQLDNANLVHGFHELYSIIERYPNESADTVGTDYRAIKWLKSVTKFVLLETFRAALRHAIGLLF